MLGLARKSGFAFGPAPATESWCGSKNTSASPRRRSLRKLAACRPFSREIAAVHGKLKQRDF